jgi:hypothetical protein
MTTDKKRSLLREAKQLMDATFVGGGKLAAKVRSLVLEAYSLMTQSKINEAAQKLKEAYEIMKEANAEEDHIDYEKALYALDIGFFIYAFAKADERLRKIAWDIWDARNEFQAALYDAISTARILLSMADNGEKWDAAQIETLKKEEASKLKEILKRYDTQEERVRDTGRHCEGSN